MNTTWTDLIIDVLLFIYVIDCVFMGLVILMQRSKQEGLGAAFGGGMMDSAFGPGTSTVLVKATVYAAIIFFVLSITLARLYSHRAALTQETSTVQQELMKPGIPATTNAAPVTAPLTTPATNASPSTPAPVAPTAPPQASSTPAPAPTSAPANAPAKPANK